MIKKISPTIILSLVFAIVLFGCTNQPPTYQTINEIPKPTIEEQPSIAPTQDPLATPTLFINPAANIDETQLLNDLKKETAENFDKDFSETETILKP